MYIPNSFRIADPVKLQAFMDAYSFATLVTYDGKESFATHLPMRNFWEGNQCLTLAAHMARANPQWRHFSVDSEVLAVFMGPHAYISPSWYATNVAVPTWNYASVHVYGRPVIIEDHDRVVSLLADTVNFYESSFDRPWPDLLPTEYRDQLIEAIVAFEIHVTRVEGKFKLGQNRSTADNNGVVAALAQIGDSNSKLLADLMISEGLVPKREDVQ